MSAELPLIVTPGDPRGIGAEVAVRALSGLRRPVLCVGDPLALQQAAIDAGLPAPPHLAPPAGEEPVEVRAIRHAVDLIRAGEAAGLVTGPIHKGRLVQRGFRFTGHTDLLGHLCGVPDPVMAFVGGRVRVALVTVHLPLRRVPEALTATQIVHVLRTADRALRVDLGLRRPRLLVCGLNPHAGDDGALGDEEQQLIGPAVDEARREQIDARGPMSAEAAFVRALRDEGDMVVAMYHDQGLAPLKALDFGSSVNWTLGLPMLRTSVDHGTADDLAGTGRADPSSMVAALRLADQLASRRSRPWMPVDR